MVDPAAAESEFVDASLVATVAARPTSRLSGARVMILSTWHPVPADNGRKQRTLGLIDALAAECEITLVSLLPPDEVGAESRSAFVPGVAHQATLPLPVFQSRSYQALAGAFHRWPRSVVATWSPSTAGSIVDIARLTRADVVIGTDLRTLRYLRHLKEADRSLKTVLDEPDVSPFLTVDRALSAGSKSRARLRRRKYATFLRDAVDDLDAVLVAAPGEAAAYQRLSGGQPAEVVANGVTRFPSPWAPPKAGTLLYTGSLTYSANLEAVTWFTHTVLPLLRGQMSSPVLTITGIIPDELPHLLKQPAIRFTGRVDDLDPAYRAARALVAPLLSGTGTRIKILEAMAIGIPVITTSKGCEGIPLVPGEHALVADTPEAFAIAVLRVVSDPDYAQTIGARGRAFVQHHGRWETSAERFREIVSRLLPASR